MLNKLLQFIAPHYCYGCGEVGAVLCANCKYDIVDEGFDGCIMCTRPARDGICVQCRTSYDRAWCVGERHGLLRRLIDGYKFERVIDAANSLADLLDARLPQLPGETVIVPVPTIASHVRQRGYDHTVRIANRLGRQRSLSVQRCISRMSSTVQRGHTKRQRRELANRSFACPAALNPDLVYLLLDDVVTTGATISACAAALKQAGARHVWVAVVARQPLDK